MVSDQNLLLYREGVGIVVINKENKIWVGKRLDTRHPENTEETWQMPQGGIDSGETPWQAALRELKEEIGTMNVEHVAETKDWLTYEFPDNLQESLWGGRFRGQKQKWFLVRFLGIDEQINIHTKHPEFTEWAWTDPKTLPQRVIGFKKDLYLKIIDEFGNYF